MTDSTEEKLNKKRKKYNVYSFSGAVIIHILKLLLFLSNVPIFLGCTILTLIFFFCGIHNVYKLNPTYLNIQLFLAIIIISILYNLFICGFYSFSLFVIVEGNVTYIYIPNESKPFDIIYCSVAIGLCLLSLIIDSIILYFHFHLYKKKKIGCSQKSKILTSLSYVNLSVFGTKFGITNIKSKTNVQKKTNFVVPYKSIQIKEEEKEKDRNEEITNNLKSVIPKKMKTLKEKLKIKKKVKNLEEEHNKKLYKINERKKKTEFKNLQKNNKKKNTSNFKPVLIKNAMTSLFTLSSPSFIIQSEKAKNMEKSKHAGNYNNDYV